MGISKEMQRMSFGQKLSKQFRTLLKHTLNPLTLRLATAGIGPFAIVRHVGRRSGKQYATPLLLAPIAGGLVAELTYGPNVDWFQNVKAAGKCTIVRGGKEIAIDRIEPMNADAGRQAFPLAARIVLRILRRNHYVQMYAADQ
jgi:deazaflavin-dependent oxidoreductase (nitroreductase family)